jgi:ATP-dependent RNA helicase DeaD
LNLNKNFYALNKQINILKPIPTPTFVIMQNKNYSVETILNNLQIKALNEMQVASIEANSNNNNVVLLSATGSGKTLAFLLPVVELLDIDNKATQALIIVPSRELAQQIEVVFKSMGTGLKISSCYGGHKRETEENNLIQPPAIIVGTAGRLADHIRRGNITIDTIETLVLDEFDKTMEAGFTEEVSFIIQSIPNIKKRILTSATLTKEIPNFIGLQDEIQLNFLKDDELPKEKLVVKKLLSNDTDKIDSLFRLICMNGDKSTIVFCNHREEVEITSKQLVQMGIVNEFYHGAMEQQERDSALCKFRNGTVNTLITTDLASRGLDIANVRYIIHHQLPHTQDIFTHRNGRTARMDASGTVIIILGKNEYLPSFIEQDIDEITLPQKIELPQKPAWTTIFIAAGKKNKVNKVDIVGFLSKVGELKKEDIGLIEVKDFFSFVAIKKIKLGAAMQLIKEERIKGKKVKIEVAR